MPMSCKQCPVCKSLAAINAMECAGCGHVYRTDFGGVPLDQTQVVPSMAPPVKYAPTSAAFVAVLVALAIIIGIGTPSLLNYTSHGTSREAISKVKFGMTVQDVRGLLGDPDNSQDMQSTGMRLQMWYYNTPSGMVQIGFENGYVNSVNRY